MIAGILEAIADFDTMSQDLRVANSILKKRKEQ